jgi:C4-dicarboxylate-specific signal transduction histidine kinase
MNLKHVPHIVTGTRILTVILLLSGLMMVWLAVHNFSAVVKINDLRQQGHVDEAVSIEKSKDYATAVTFTSVLFLLLTAWLIMLHMGRESHKVLLETNRTLSQRTAELAELNRTLDAKVYERTDSLQRALEQLQKAHEDLRTAQGQLLQSEKFSAIGQLAAGIAHEINNPIGFINSNIQTLTQYVNTYRNLFQLREKFDQAVRDKDYEKASAMLSEVEKFKKIMNFSFINSDVPNLLKESYEGAQKIHRIIEDLRTFASPDKESMGSVKVDAIMESMINIVWNEIKYKVELKKEYSPVPAITCNPQKIAQVFVNLLMNSAQAIKDKGIITIRTYTKDGFVCVDVADNGGGISPQNSIKIFDPFFTTKPVGQGTGLGLSICYDIIKKHGGSITFTSKLGEGTTFTVMLPESPMAAMTGGVA